MVVCGDQTSAPREFQQRDAFLDGAAGDAEEVFAVGFREATVSLGDVGGDGQGCAVELVGEETVTAGEVLGFRADLVCEIDGFLVNA